MPRPPTWNSTLLGFPEGGVSLVNVTCLNLNVTAVLSNILTLGQ